MRALAVVLALACATAAAEGDAPRIVKLRGGEGVTTAAGAEVEIRPDSCLFTAEACIENGKKLAALREQVAKLEESQGVPLPVVVGIILGTAAAAYGVGRLAR